MAAPLGNQNAAVDKRQWRRAIERALGQRSLVAQRDALDDLAEKLLVKCEEGDMSAIRELGDRLDGKPAQTISGDPDAPLVPHSIVVSLVRKDA